MSLYKLCPSLSSRRWPALTNPSSARLECVRVAEHDRTASATRRATVCSAVCRRPDVPDDAFAAYNKWSEAHTHATKEPACEAAVAFIYDDVVETMTTTTTTTAARISGCPQQTTGSQMSERLSVRRRRWRRRRLVWVASARRCRRRRRAPNDDDGERRDKLQHSLRTSGATPHTHTHTKCIINYVVLC